MQENWISEFCHWHRLCHRQPLTSTHTHTHTNMQEYTFKYADMQSGTQLKGAIVDRLTFIYWALGFISLAAVE